MTTIRAIQNFRGFRGIWWGPSGHHADALRVGLSRLGVATAAFDDIGTDGLKTDRDVLFVDADFLFDPARAAQSGQFLSLVPVIGVVGVEAPSRLKTLSDIGATAFLHKPIHPATVYSSLFLAVNNHARFARLEAQVEEHNRRRGGRRYVVRAIIALMHQDGITDEQAYAHLRRESMKRRVGLEDFAQSLCEAFALLDHFIPPAKQETHHASEDEASCDRGLGSDRLVGADGSPRRRSDQAWRARGPIR